MDKEVRKDNSTDREGRGVEVMVAVVVVLLTKGELAGRWASRVRCWQGQKDGLSMLLMLKLYETTSGDYGQFGEGGEREGRGRNSRRR